LKSSFAVALLFIFFRPRARTLKLAPTLEHRADFSVS
jgi:hypothetical protein